MLTKKIIFFLSIIAVLFISCDTDVEINAPEFSEELTSSFKVNFNGGTWLADNATAAIIDGEITITAIKNNGQETIIINLLSDEIGLYPLASATNNGNIEYEDTQNTGGAFITSDDQFSGSINLISINNEDQILSGEFFFIGRRSIQQFESDGEPSVDTEGNFIFNIEEIDFTNGVFENIVFTSDVNNPTTGENEFFVLLDEEEFVETTLTAVKENGSITIRVSRNGSVEVIEIRMPEDIASDSFNLYTTAPDSTQNSEALYKNVALQQVFGPADPADTETTSLTITSHNQNTNKIIGKFKFFANRIGGGNETHTFTEGTFSVTYTE